MCTLLRRIIVIAFYLRQCAQHDEFQPTLITHTHSAKEENKGQPTQNGNLCVFYTYT